MISKTVSYKAMAALTAGALAACAPMARTGSNSILSGQLHEAYSEAGITPGEHAMDAYLAVYYQGAPESPLAVVIDPTRDYYRFRPKDWKKARGDTARQVVLNGLEKFGEAMDIEFRLRNPKVARVGYFLGRDRAGRGLDTTGEWIYRFEMAKDGRTFSAYGDMDHGNDGNGHDTGGGNSDSDGSGCFLAGTLVLMADGSYKPIEALNAGDRVKGFDVDSGRPVSTQVVRTFEKQRRGYYSFNGLGASGEHPFYAEMDQTVEVKDLDDGSSVLGDRDGDLSTLERLALGEITRIEAPTTVHNIEVEGTHNYFVKGIGSSGYGVDFLVHNKSSGD